MSLLENYYDRFWAGRFDASFAGTDIGQHPTGEQSRYVVLRFDFSAVNDKIETLEQEFDTYCEAEIHDTLVRYPDLFHDAAAQRILAPPSASAKLNELFLHTKRHGILLYVLIDEYDNFANTVLAQHGAEAYHDFTHGGGFYRNFFATLKAATARSGGGLERLFIIGVSPVTTFASTVFLAIANRSCRMPLVHLFRRFRDSIVPSSRVPCLSLKISRLTSERDSGEPCQGYRHGFFEHLRHLPQSSYVSSWQTHSSSTIPYYLQTLAAHLGRISRNHSSTAL